MQLDSTMVAQLQEQGQYKRGRTANSKVQIVTRYLPSLSHACRPLYSLHYPFPLNSSSAGNCSTNGIWHEMLILWVAPSAVSAEQHGHWTLVITSSKSIALHPVPHNIDECRPISQYKYCLNPTVVCIRYHGHQWFIHSFSAVVIGNWTGKLNHQSTGLFQRLRPFPGHLYSK